MYRPGRRMKEGESSPHFISLLPCSAGSQFICAQGQHKSLLIWIRCVLLGKQQSIDRRLMITKAETWAPLPAEDEASSGELWLSLTTVGASAEGLDQTADFR